MHTTEKLYYKDFFLSQCTARVVSVNQNKVLLDRTVAFPEGGGQKGDRGIIITGNKAIQFWDTQKGVGRVLHLEDFPTIQVETPIYHIINETDAEYLKAGVEVIVKIDVAHRIGTTTMHSALHIALMAATEIVPEKVRCIKGCSITDHSARLDFFTRERFTQGDMEQINKRAQDIIDNDYMIKSYAHPSEAEAWYWECEGFRCPCGGTHVQKTGDIGTIHVKRKSTGKNNERLTVSLSDSKLTEASYHI